MSAVGGISDLKILLEDFNQFEVPQFQRNYSWSDDQVIAFMTDLKMSAQYRFTHFLGSIILMPDNQGSSRKKFFVIDGQQRLTTIYILLCVLRDRLVKLPSSNFLPEGSNRTINVKSKLDDLLYSDDTGTPRFLASPQIRKMFNKYILSEDTNENPREKMPTVHKPWSLELRKAHSLINQEIENLLSFAKSDDDKLKILYSIYRALARNFQILAITTSDYSESFNIFMTLNARGMPLGPSDLVKSIFMKYLSEGVPQSEIENFNERIAVEWNSAAENLESGDFNQFLRHLLLVENDNPVQSKYIFSFFEQAIMTDPLKSKTIARTYLDKIIEKSEIYEKLLLPLELSDPKLQEHCIYLKEFSDSYRIAMLAVLDPKNELSIVDQREIARLIEVLTIRWIIAGGNAQEIEDHYQAIARLIQNKQNIMAIKNKILIKYVSDDTLKPFFNSEIKKTNIVRVVLHRINREIGDISHMMIYDPSKMNVEHIAPKTPTDQWVKALYPKEKDIQLRLPDYELKVESWGNKTILDKPINSSIKQKSFKEKSSQIDKKSYKLSPLKITNELAKLSEWNLDEIELRNQWIAECFLALWAAEPNTQNILQYTEWRKIRGVN